jgi:hypothetical protein
MAKGNDPVATDVDDDELFAPGSWDIGPPSARRQSMRPGGRSKRPPANPSSPPAASAAAVADAPAEAPPPETPVVKKAVKSQRASVVKAKSERATASAGKRRRSLPAPAAAEATAVAVEPSPAAATDAPRALADAATAPALASGSEPAPAPPELQSAPLLEPDLSNADDAEPDSVSGARLVHPSRRAASPTSSFRPVVPELASQPAPRRRATLASSLPLVSFVLSSVGVGFLLFGRAPAEAGESATGPTRAALAAATPARAAAPPAALVANPAAKARDAVVVSRSEPDAARATEAVAASAAATVKGVVVELSVYPVDAAVGYLGVMQRGGPPYRFEVPPGKKLAVEVARPGYGTRKVTLDGSTPRLSIGLRKTPSGG